MDLKEIISERLRRQRLIEPIEDPGQYLELFRLLQPVSPVFFSAPGSPPRMVHRTTFDDGLIADRMREQRTIIKGRFLGGTIGYVMSEDLELYANAFRRQLPGLNDLQQAVFDAIRSSETLTPRQIKAETGLLSKQIGPALSRLQAAFLVYEDQIDSSWERNWYEFAAEWPEVNLDEGLWETAAAQVLLRFLQGHVFATLEQFKDWSLLPSKRITKLVHDMEKDGSIVTQAIKGLGEGWICRLEVPLRVAEIPPSVFMLHRSDFLVRSHVSELKRRFDIKDILQYLLIDGKFQGAVIGHWRIGPYDVDDIIVELPTVEQDRRREEILNAVSWGYRPPHHHILRYAGRTVNHKLDLKKA